MSEWSSVGSDPIEVMTEEELRKQILALNKDLKSFKLDKTWNQHLEERIRIYSEAYKGLTGKEWSEREQTEASG